MPSPINVAAARDRRFAVLAFVAQYTHEHGFGPTQGVIAAHFSVSVGTTKTDLVWLRDQGRLTWDLNKPRTIRLT